MTNGADPPYNAVPADVTEFLANLTEEDKMLIVLKRELYEGSWDDMQEDLENRLSGKPFIFKLANRIQDDIERIGRLRTFELEHHVDLSDYVDSGLD